MLIDEYLGWLATWWRIWRAVGELDVPFIDDYIFDCDRP